jgi:hypothetical protein
MQSDVIARHDRSTSRVVSDRTRERTTHMVEQIEAPASVSFSDERRVVDRDRTTK